MTLQRLELALTASYQPLGREIHVLNISFKMFSRNQWLGPSMYTGGPDMLESCICPNTWMDGQIMSESCSSILTWCKPCFCGTSCTPASSPPATQQLNDDANRLQGIREINGWDIPWDQPAEELDISRNQRQRDRIIQRLRAFFYCSLTKREENEKQALPRQIWTLIPKTSSWPKKLTWGGMSHKTSLWHVGPSFDLHQRVIPNLNRPLPHRYKSSVAALVSYTTRKATWALIARVLSEYIVPCGSQESYEETCGLRAGPLSHIFYSKKLLNSQRCPFNLQSQP